MDALLFDRDKNEQENIRLRMSNSVAILSYDRLKCESFESAESVDLYLAKDPTLDMSVIELKDDGDIELSKRVRSLREQSDIMLLADSSISPMKYMIPSIRACSLLLKPFEKEEMEAVVHEFVASYYRKRETPSDESSIIIENRDGRIVVPLSHIYYIEARAKKVYFRLRDREYSKYDTLENVRSQLPATFVQSHRSFIFNTAYLDRIKLSENSVFLENNITVPLSRSFKAYIKEYLSGISGKGNSDI